MVDTTDAIDAEAPEAHITLHIGFLLMPEYTLSTFSNAVSVLRMANRLSGRELYRYSVFSLDGEPVVSSAGLELRLDGSLKSVGDMSVLVVCGGYNVKNYCTKEVLDGLRLMAKKQIPLAGMCTGSYVLAAAGLLDGYRSTIHWENIASMREQFPKLNIGSSLFVID
jgi:transcriptional regulator GlxA family with amidase domain